MAQSPPTPGIADLGSAIPFAAGSNVIAQLQEQEATKQSQDAFLKAITLNRGLGNQGSFSSNFLDTSDSRNDG